MGTQQIAVSYFCEHAVDALEAVEKNHVLVELVRDGQIVAYLSPAAPSGQAGSTLADWVGSGVGTMSYGPGYDPHEPAFSPDDWDAFSEAKK